MCHHRHGASEEPKVIAKAAHGQDSWKTNHQITELTTAGPERAEVGCTAEIGQGIDRKEGSWRGYGQKGCPEWSRPAVGTSELTGVVGDDKKRVDKRE